MAARLILASASPRRLALLTQAGITPAAVIAPEIDETPKPSELPRAYALRIALAKAEAGAAAHPAALVLAADTVVAMGRRTLPKAENETQARTCLELLSGRRHRVYTAVAVRRGADVTSKIVETAVRFKRLSQGEKEAYIASGEWRGKAGGYAIQGRAETLIPWISGSYSNVVGLPLHETWNLLAAAGFAKEGTL